MAIDLSAAAIATKSDSPQPKSTATVTRQERIFFVERLTLLLETGHPLHVALQVLQSQSGISRLQRVAADIENDIAQGSSFARALEQHPNVFSKTFTNLVAAGEAGGFLPEVLNELVHMEEKADRLRSTIVSACSYPAFLVTFSVAVVAFVLIVVFPKFEVMFAAIHDQLPKTTLALMWASNMLTEHWAWICIAVVAGIGGIWLWARSVAGMTLIDRAKLRIPVLRTLFAEIYLIYTMRVISLSINHGVSVPEALQACREVVRNREFRALMDDVIKDVHEGKGISSGFGRSPFVPSLAKEMLATGDRAGELALVMRRLADFFDRELSRRLTAFSKVVEPFMLLVMGVVVGVIVTSLILPIFKLSKAVH
ncbi:MAG: type II secretion system F family protein [Gammaproteobacteria bacterium]|nr:type II secretion system F family protein [Gammaproteobacteria bacterium]